MNDAKPEFDRFRESYDQLLRDPIRDGFTAGQSQFFHTRKRDLILEHFRRRQIDTSKLSYLDFGCGRGELACLLKSAFARVAGCDTSAGMLASGSLASQGIETRLQSDPGEIPFQDSEFDFVTAVCVFHHIPPAHRPAALREMCRVAKPGGTLAVIEHNPCNPITQLIVRRTPVDANAILLRPVEVRRLFRAAGLTAGAPQYFLYLPEPAYRLAGFLERLFSRVPLGGQYSIFGRSGKNQM
jgi:ubiquinone/menaquinone biosynthesis C-methylase UbiE